MTSVNMHTLNRASSHTSLLSKASAARDKRVVNALSQDKECIFSLDANDWISLRVLFLRHMKQNRWIYFLNDQLTIKTNTYPVLQVKLKDQQDQYDAILKIIQHGQAGAVIIERTHLSKEQINILKDLCTKQNMILVLLNTESSNFMH